MDEPKGFYVEPKYDCPHIDEYFKADEKLIAATAPCTTCQDEKENWACLTCNQRFCSRYINAHMQAHNTQSGHPICTSYSDLSIWCYSCDSYIADPRFTNLLKQMGVAKFGDAGTGGRYTAHSTKEQMEEKYDSPKVLKKKVQQLAALIKKSKHFISFTGAGISTSAGIPDFRGPQGVWTLKATGQRRTAPTVNFLSALPSVCHMALVGLAQAGKLKYTISQNVDGLHRRSGISPNDLAELHGNTNLEVCSKCCKEYMRDFECMKGGGVNHVTARKCSVEECGGELLDTIINFGESLPIHYLQGGFEEANKADLCLVLGSSLGVTPAADMPKIVGKKKYGDLVIVNLQKTPLDKLATIRIFGKCDEVMEMLMKELEIDIPPFILKRTVIISHDENQIKVEGIDVDGTPLSLFCGVEAEFSDSDRKQPIDAQDGPFHFPRKQGDGPGVKVTLHFFGHYNEPPYTLDYNISDSKGAKKYLLQFDPEKGIWAHDEEEATEKDLSQGKGGQDDMMKKYPTQVEDERHEEHPLKLLPSVYGGVGYRCNACLRTGQGWVYTCEECQYDLHPACAIWRRGANSK